MKSISKWLSNNLIRIYAFFAFTYLFIPVAYTFVFSFNDSRKTNLIWRGFTLDKWKNPCGAPDVCSALGNSFIPLYNEKVLVDGEEESKQFIFSILNLLFVFTTLITILMIIFSDQIIHYTVNGFTPETKALASRLLKIMSSYFIFISLSGMICAVLNNFKQFMVPASTAIFFNLAIIGSSIVAGKTHGIDVLGWGVVVGGILQFIVVLPAFFKIVKKYSFKINFKDPYLLKIAIMIGPMLIGIFAKQVNTVVDQYFASYLETGGVTALENATRLYTLPIGIFGGRLGHTLLGTFSYQDSPIFNSLKEHHSTERTPFKNTLPMP
jgi:murein biosynthesis integral membrane protein MurJ